MKVAPSVNVLTREQVDRIHTSSLEILSKTGIRVDGEKALELFVSHGARVSGNRVFPDHNLVQWAIDAAPPLVEIYNRLGEKAFTLGGEKERGTRFGVGVTNLHYQDPMTDKIMPFSIRHMESAVRLGNTLEQFDVIATPGIAQDLNPTTADLFAVLEMTANTTKPLVLLISENKCFAPAMNLLEHLHGDLASRPFVIPYFNPITPLVLNQGTVDKMMDTIGRGLPFIYNNYGMSGATAPITPGGTLALLNAELLAGVLFSQLIKEGCPIIPGCLPAGFDMKTMMSIYTPHTMVLNLACAEMMNHYGLPHSGTSGSGPGWGADLTASGAFWMNHLTSCMGKVGLAPFVGGNFDSMVFSPGAVVYADEVIRLSRIFAGGFSIDDQALGLEEIDTMGPAGNFLAAPLTGKLFRELRFESAIWPSYTLEQWLTQSSPRAQGLLRDHTRQILENPRIPQDHEDIMEKGGKFIQNHMT